MNIVARPPVDSRNGDRARDDLDEVLRAFFRSELPRPWPAPQRPSGGRAQLPLRPPSAPTRPRRWFADSRLALAASLGLLLIGHLVLSDVLKPGTPNADLGPMNGTADKRADPAQFDRGKALPGRTGVEVPPAGGQPGKAGPKDPFMMYESLFQDDERPTELRLKVLPGK
jgi:hypothetical protein